MHERLFRGLVAAFASGASAQGQGKVIHYDDTSTRVQSLAKKTGPAAQKPERSGIFTTGRISQVADHTIALFVTGHRHASENLDQLLARRAANSAPLIQMCDALSRYPSKEFQSILANCLRHGRRQFVDIAQNFPQECRHVGKPGRGLPTRCRGQRGKALARSPASAPPGAQSENHGRAPPVDEPTVV
jgi:hypothetical protein